MMRKLLRFVFIGVLVILVLVGCAAMYVYVASERRLNAAYPVPPATTIVVPRATASIARGGHLFHGVATCALCHADDGGGGLYSDTPFGIIAGPNLTRGRGGIGATFGDADFERAIRHGVRADGRSLIIMQSEVFVNMSDEDTGALIAYIKQLPPIDREPPPTQLHALGLLLMVAGRLNIQVAPKVSDAHRVPMGDAAVEHGRYLANVSGCHGCHGYGLSGGRVAGPPDLPPASNLTPTGLASWKKEDFVHAIRTGQRPDGRRLNDFMPWRIYANMTDAELDALWQYLKSVPPRESGNK